jgi:hypothetical protein
LAEEPALATVGLNGVNPVNRGVYRPASAGSQPWSTPVDIPAAETADIHHFDSGSGSAISTTTGNCILSRITAAPFWILPGYELQSVEASHGVDFGLWDLVTPGC